MPVHKVSLQLAHEIPIGNVDIKLPVRSGNTLLGTLTISKGGVDWKKAHAHSSKSLTWKRFGEVMDGL